MCVINLFIQSRPTRKNGNTILYIAKFPSSSGALQQTTRCPAVKMATLSPPSPNKSRETKEKQSNRPLRPSLVHSAEPMLFRALQPRSYLLSRCPDMDWMVAGAAASALWRLAWPPPSGARSPNRRVALNNWGTRPQPERTYVWPLALKHLPRGTCAGLCGAA